MARGVWTGLRSFVISSTGHASAACSSLNHAQGRFGYRRLKSMHPLRRALMVVSIYSSKVGSVAHNYVSNVLSAAYYYLVLIELQLLDNVCELQFAELDGKGGKRDFKKRLPYLINHTSVIFTGRFSSLTILIISSIHLKMSTIGERKNVGTGLQEFILDPKSSVKKYLENSIAANSEGTANNQTPKYNPQNPQQQGNGNWNQPGGSGPNFPNPNNLAPQIPEGGVPQRPASAQSNNSFNPPPQNYQSPPPQQYTPQPSNVGPHPNEPQNYGAPPQQPAPYTNYAQPQPIKNDFQNLKQDLNQLGQGIQAMNPFSDQNQQNAPYPPSAYAQQQAPLFGGAAPLQDQRHIGPAPPPPEQQAYAQALPASRLYHRMICDYETIKSIFYAAKMRTYLLSYPTHLDKLLTNLFRTRPQRPQPPRLKAQESLPRYLDPALHPLSRILLQRSRQRGANH